MPFLFDITYAYTFFFIIFNQKHSSLKQNQVLAYTFCHLKKLFQSDMYNSSKEKSITFSIRNLTAINTMLVFNVWFLSVLVPLAGAAAVWAVSCVERARHIQSSLREAHQFKRDSDFPSQHLAFSYSSGLLFVTKWTLYRRELKESWLLWWVKVIQ